MSEPEKLRGLTLGPLWNIKVTYFSNIFRFKNLRRLALWSYIPLDLTPLKSLKNLRDLKIELRTQKEFNFLSSLENLVEFSFSFEPGNNILQNLENLGNLKLVTLIRERNTVPPSPEEIQSLNKLLEIEFDFIGDWTDYQKEFEKTFPPT